MPSQPPRKRPSNSTPREPSAGSDRATGPMLGPVAPPVPARPGRTGLGLGIAVDAGEGGVVTARQAGGLRDLALDVDHRRAHVKAALQNLAKAVNIAFQTDYGENYLEAVYQAAIVRQGQVRIVHKEYFGFGETWFGQLGKLLRSLGLSLQGPDPASPEGQLRIAERGPASIRGLLNLLGRKLDLVAEFEDRVPAYVEQMFDRLEASGIIVGWDRNLWSIETSRIGLDIRIAPAEDAPPAKTKTIKAESIVHPPIP